MNLKQYLKLLRPHQWYKNSLVFLALIFVELPTTWPWDTLPAIFNLSYYPPLILGFAAFCAVSSAGYIINDVQDIEKDAAHPEKKHRPLPSGAVDRTTSLAIAAILLVTGLALSYILDSIFFILVVAYIFNSQLYNYYLRNWAIVDVTCIAVGFVIRAVAGTFLIHVPFTSWLIMGVFFFALVLGFGKRKNELQLMGEEAPKHKSVFTQYNHAILDQAISMSATWVVFFYTLYCYANFHAILEAQPIILTVPVAAGLVLRYVYLIQSGSPVGRKPHLAFTDKGIIAGTIILGIVLIVTLLFWIPLLEFIQGLFPPVVT